ncbi:MAG TPA: PAS domain-containing sensor histidine kinase, partial [Glaciihabitans sp.]|nr:PAS domain-containing sensor histidine kinase [Glaciihabitans sp.]
MPLFELQPTQEGRIRVFARAQLPFFLATMLLATVCAFVLPEHFWSPWFLGAMALVVLGSLLLFVAPWDRISSNWLILIALADIVAVAFIRLELYNDVPGLGILAVFPVLWLSYGFRPAVMFVGVAGSLFITTFPYMLRQQLPQSALEWINALLLPACVVFMAVAVGTAARQLRRSRVRVEQHAARLEVALRESQDAELIARAVFQTVDAAMAFYGVHNKPVIANEQAYQVVSSLGFSLDKPPYAGHDVFEADRVTRIPFSEQIIPRALRGEEIAGHIEWLGPPGDQKAILASTKRVHREDGTVLGTFIACFDITDLANAVSVREQFLTTVSHELRTPLTSIM